MMLVTHLKPCPFCGDKYLHYHTEKSKDGTLTWHYLMHSPKSQCSIKMLDDTQDNLFNKWNTRKSPTLKP